MIGKLIILHCQLDMKAQVASELLEMRTIDQCFTPETCSRQIYIYIDLSADKIRLLESLCEQLKGKTSQIEVRYGYDAYEFLLNWTIGVLSPKLKQNDHFVLGKLRKYWDSYLRSEKENPFLHQLMPIIPEILKQSSLIRNYIQTHLIHFNDATRIDYTKQYCHYIRQMAENPTISLSEPSFIAKPKTIEELQAEREKLQRCIKSLQKDAPAQTIRLHPDPNDEVSIAQLRKFSVAIGQIAKKRELESNIAERTNTAASHIPNA